MLTLAAFMAAIGLPVVAVFNGWATCFRKDNAGLPLLHRVTPIGWVLLACVTLLSVLNGGVIYAGGITEGARANRLERQLRAAQTELGDLRKQTLRAFVDDLDVRSWHQTVSMAARAVHLQHRSQLMLLMLSVGQLRWAEPLWRAAGATVELPAWIRPYHEMYYTTLRYTINWVKRAGDDYSAVMEHAGIRGPVSQAMLERNAELLRRLPDVPAEFERFQREFGFSAEVAQVHLEGVSTLIDSLYEGAQLVIETEHVQRLTGARPSTQ
jgi:hypothetical protein